MPTICLCMMVKNEAAIIRRSLESALPFIDTWMIHDTGSTDGTQDIIREVLGGIPGKLVEVPWTNFGVNRTLVVEAARSMADYLLILDADLELRVDTPVADTMDIGGVGHRQRAIWLQEKLTADAYELRYQGDMDYSNTRILSTRHEWHYVGVTHEYVTSETAGDSVELREVTLIDHGDGANRVDKFDRDLKLLHEDLKTDPDNARTVFYIAQSYRGWEKFEEALAWYQRRVEMDGYEEERWYSAMMVGRIRQHLDHDPALVRKAYLDAYFLRPSRLEPICWLAQYCRLNRDHEMAFLFSSIAATDAARYPSSDRLFIDRSVYDFLLLYEFGMAATLTGRMFYARWSLDVLEFRNGVAAHYQSLEATIEAMSEHIATYGEVQ